MHSPGDLRELIDSALEDRLPRSRLRTAPLLESAIRYAMFPGGKRLRPTLTLLSGSLVGCDLQQVIPVACAIEFLHASSLILDDLPCMDNEQVRRGKPALHRRFGEDIAVLAAMALLNESYAIFARSPGLIEEAVKCIGPDGMIGGQAADLAPGSSRGQRYRKTTALMRLTMTGGAIAASADRQQVASLGRVGEDIGEAYQLWDDVADGHLGYVEGCQEASRLMEGARRRLERDFAAPCHLIRALEQVASAMQQAAGQASASSMVTVA